jgi:hypothetical protein
LKHFRSEIEKLFSKLKNKENFAFSKYADGEWASMNGLILDNNEFRSDHSTQHSRKLLIDSFKYKHDNYFVGISCYCCQGSAYYDMKKFSGQNESNLTFANIFVNSNYSYYKQNFIPEYSNHKVNLIANEKSSISNLPFKVERFFPVKKNAWVENLLLINEIKSLNINNELFLFCCGPFGNILAHQLWENNKNNTYIDIGSTLNPWLQTEGFKRSYLYGGSDNEKVCVWK